MMAPPKPYNERQRLAALRAWNSLDTDLDERFDSSTWLALAAAPCHDLTAPSNALK